MDSHETPPQLVERADQALWAAKAEAATATSPPDPKTLYSGAGFSSWA
jgi:hypothetical protein